MRWLRFGFIVVYSCYLVYAGMTLILLPWSQLWPRLILHLPHTLAYYCGFPAVRGIISAFGVLHLFLLAFELLPPEVRRRFGC